MDTSNPPPTDTSTRADASVPRVRLGWVAAGAVPLTLSVYIAWHEIRMARIQFDDWATAGGAVLLGALLLCIGLQRWKDRMFVLLALTVLTCALWIQATRAVQASENRIADRREVRDALMALAPVCAGTGVASAAAYVPGASNAALRIRWTRDEAPGFPMGAFDATGERELTEPSAVSLVACWEILSITTAVCSFTVRGEQRVVQERFGNQTRTRTERLPDEHRTVERTRTSTTVTLREARTGRLLDSIFDPGVDPGPCGDSGKPQTPNHGAGLGARGDAAFADWVSGARPLP